MHYYLAPYVGAGRDDDPHRPEGVDEHPSWAAIDLRPPGAADGLALVAVTSRRDGARRDYLGNEPRGRSQAVRQLLGSRLGLTLQADTFDAAVLELLTEHARDDRSRWRPLQPTRRGDYEVHLGGLLVRVQAIRGGATFTESFNQADSTTLGPDLTWAETNGNMQTVGSQVRGVTAGGFAEARAEHDVGGNDMYAQMEIVALEEGTAQVSLMDVCCRFSASARTYYFSRTQRAAGDDRRVLGRRLAGVFGGIVLGAPGTFVPAGAIIRVEADGSTIRLKADGVTLEQGTNTDIAAGQRGGIALRGQDSTAEAILDNFETGQLLAGHGPLLSHERNHLVRTG